MNQTTEAKHECEHFLMMDVAVYCCDCDNIQIVDVKDGHTTEYVPKGRSVDRIKELEELVNDMHIGLVSRGHYINSVTFNKVEALKEKYKF